jgi:hypothetical protein
MKAQSHAGPGSTLGTGFVLGTLFGASGGLPHTGAIIALALFLLIGTGFIVRWMVAETGAAGS